MQIKPLQRYLFPVLITFLVTMIALLGSEVEAWLRYDRTLILSGQLWRVLSAHFVHLGHSHMWMNLAGLWLIWLIFHKHITVAAWWITVLLCAIGISIMLLVLNTSLLWYVGFSGVLHGLFILGCIVDMRGGRKDSLFILAFIILKLIWEQAVGPLPFSEETAGGNVIVDAHLYGAIGGSLCVLIFWRHAWFKPQKIS